MTAITPGPNQASSSFPFVGSAPIDLQQQNARRIFDFFYSNVDGGFTMADVLPGPDLASYSFSLRRTSGGAIWGSKCPSCLRWE